MTKRSNSFDAKYCDPNIYPGKYLAPNRPQLHIVLCTAFAFVICNVFSTVLLILRILSESVYWSIRIVPL